MEICTQSYGPPKSRETQLWEFLDFHLGILGQNDIWVLILWPCIEYIIKGKVLVSLKSGPWWVLWVCVCLWFVRATKYFNYALINLLFSLRMSIWIIELLVNLPSPILELQHATLPSKWCQPRSTPQLFTFPLFSPLDSQLNPSRNLGVH